MPSPRGQLVKIDYTFKMALKKDAAFVRSCLWLWAWPRAAPAPMPATQPLPLSNQRPWGKHTLPPFCGRALVTTVCQRWLDFGNKNVYWGITEPSKTGSLLEIISRMIWARGGFVLFSAPNVCAIRIQKEWRITQTFL